MIDVGYYPNLSDKEYHADFAISSSALVHALRSPAHFWANYVGNPNRIEQNDTKALKYGRAIHKFLLEQSDFINAYIIAPKVDKRTKEGKMIWAEMEAKAEAMGAEVITADDAAMITAMSDAMRDFNLVSEDGRSMTIQDVFSNGKAEESFFWKDPATGILLRARTDWRVGDVIVDYKTTLDARPMPFASEVAKRRYYMRAAMYMDGVEAVTGKRPTDFYIVAQEKAAPFCCAAYRINPDDIAFGRRQYQNALKGIKACFDARRWSGYSELVQVITIPSYYYDDLT